MSESGDQPTVPLRPGREPRVATITAESATVDVPPPDAFAKDWSDADRYALVSEIARGGGGRIALAIDRKLGRKVALKRALDADGDSRLEREALVLARLEHPAIVAMHDAGCDRDGSPFYTMKLVDGENLAKRIAATTTFEQRLALLPVVTTVADAMAYAHGRRVIHRDLKPGNVLVGELGEVAVIDWGLAKVLGETDTELTGAASTDAPTALTVHGAVMGTPAYMAPEQATATTVDARADVYALGAMLYHVLTGVVAYGDLDADATLARLLAEPPPPIDEREPRVPRELAAIVGKAMARDVEARYPTAEQLAEDLHRYQTGRLVAAHRYRLWTRAWKWLRRHQTAAAIAVVTLAIATTTSVLVLGVGAPSDETCVGLDAPVVAAWNRDVRTRARAAFSASKHPRAEAAWALIEPAVDDHAARITAMRVDACRATRVRKEQTETLMTARMECLDRRTSELEVLAKLLVASDRGTVERADQLPGALGSVADCGNVEQLGARAVLPTDPQRRAEILAIERELTELAAFGLREGFGGYDMEKRRLHREGSQVRTATKLAERARKTAYEPVIARAELRLALAAIAGRRFPTALTALHAASAVADRARDDATRARALVELLKLEIDENERVAVAADLYEQAAAAADRSRDTALAAALLVFRSKLAVLNDRPPDAIAFAERAIASGGLPYEARRALAAAYLAADRSADAARVIQANIDELRTRVGSNDHTEIAAGFGILAQIAHRTGDLDQAIQLEEKELAINAGLAWPDVTAWLSGRVRLAMLYDAAGRNTDAWNALNEVLADVDHLLGDTNADNIPSKTSRLAITIALHMGRVAEHGKQLDLALLAYADAIARAEAGNHHVPEYAGAYVASGRVRLQLDDAKLAVRDLRTALTLQMLREGPEATFTAAIRFDLGGAFLAAGDPGNATTELAQAVFAADKREDPLLRGVYRLAFAQALWRGGRKPDAKTIAAKAREWLGKAGDRGKPALAELDAWEATRGN